MPVCKKCKQEKEKEKFRTYENGKHAPTCLKCYQSVHRNRKTRFIWSLGKMGMTEFDYQNLLDKQGGSCAICQKKFTSARTNLSIPRSEWPNVDHCHKTGFVRGIVCTPCNHGLGNFRDNSESLVRAVSYLSGPHTTFNVSFPVKRRPEDDLRRKENKSYYGPDSAPF